MIPPIERLSRHLARLNGLNPDTKDYFGDPEWKRFSETVRRVVNELREMGFITSEGLDLIHAEEDANGVPRSSVLPGQNGGEA